MDSIRWDCLELLGFLSTNCPGSAANLCCRICWQVCLFSILRSFALYNTPEFPWCGAWHTLTQTQWYLPFYPLSSLVRLSQWSAALLYCHVLGFYDLERKMYNYIRRMCNEIRKMYNEIKVKQMPTGQEGTWGSLQRHPSVAQWRRIHISEECPGWWKQIKAVWSPSLTRGLYGALSDQQ